MKEKSKNNAKTTTSIKQQKLKNLADALNKGEVTPEEISEQLKFLNPTASESIELVDLLNEMAERLPFGEQPQKMLQFSERAFQIANHIGYKKGQAYSFIFIGISQWFTSALSDSLKNLLKSKHIFMELDDYEGQMKALIFEGGVYRSMGDYDQSYLDLQRGGEFFNKQGNTFWEAIALISLAMTCEQIWNWWNRATRLKN